MKPVIATDNCLFILARSLFQQTRALAETAPCHLATGETASSSSLPQTAQPQVLQHGFASDDSPQHATGNGLAFTSASHIEPQLDLHEFAAQEAYHAQLAAYANALGALEPLETTEHPPQPSHNANVLPSASVEVRVNALHLYPFTSGFPQAPSSTPPLTQSSSAESLHPSLNGTSSPLATPFPDVRVVSPNMDGYESASRMPEETITSPSSMLDQYMPVFIPGSGYFLVPNEACIPYNDVHHAVPQSMPNGSYQASTSRAPLSPVQLKTKPKAQRRAKPKKPSARSTPKSDTLKTNAKEKNFRCSWPQCKEAYTLKKDCERHYRTKHTSIRYYCPNSECETNEPDKPCGPGFSRYDSFLRHAKKPCPKKDRDP